MSFVKNYNQQLTLLDSTFNLTEREKRMLEKSWAKTFADKVFPAIDENIFSVLYSEKDDYNKCIYHKQDMDATERTIVVMKDADVLIKVCDSTGDFDDTSEYQLLIRLLKERTIIDGDGSRRLRQKEEVENPSEVLLNPSDPEATFRYKAGGKHLGYVGNVVESVGEKSSLVIDYDYQQNTYADNQFMKDYLKEKKDFCDGSFIVADGAYSGEENPRLASEHNLKLVTTNFTGRKPDEIYADFIFTENGQYLLKCKNGCIPEECKYDPHNDCSIAYFKTCECENCPYKKSCNPRFLKKRVRKEVSWKSVGRAKQLQYMKTEEFSEYAKFRNGVEAIPSLLRRRYHVDKIPVHGKKRTRLFFGFKIAALDFQKLLDYTNSLASYASNKKTA